jgi:hypothetical protein
VKVNADEVPSMVRSSMNAAGSRPTRGRDQDIGSVRPIW